MLRPNCDYSGKISAKPRKSDLNRGEIHQSFLPKGQLGAIDDNPYKFDVAKAKELLAKAGLADGFTLTMDTRNIQPITGIAENFQQTLGQAGVKLAFGHAVGKGVDPVDSGHDEAGGEPADKATGDKDEIARYLRVFGEAGRETTPVVV